MHAVCVFLKVETHFKLYVIGLDRLSYFPIHCGIETQMVFFINVTGKWKVVYTVEWHPDEDSQSTEGDFSYFPILLYQVLHFYN